MSPFNSNKGVKKQVALDGFTLSIVLILLAAIIALLFITGGYFIFSRPASPGNGNVVENDGDSTQVSGDATYPFKQKIDFILPGYAEDSVIIEGADSDFAVLLDVTNNKIIASKSSTAEIYPASMTKIMTLIVIAENLKSADSLNDKLTVTQEYYDRKVSEDHSGDLNKVGQVLTVNDMIYNLILQSDGIAAMALADYIAGSEDAFVDMMNAKATEMGLTKTQFKNATGMHETYHLTTAYEMSAIMMYAMKNPFCANVLSAMSHTNYDGTTAYHQTLVTKLHNDQPKYTVCPSTAKIIAAKSGWTGSDSGHCLATYAKGNNGLNYVLVTAKAESSQLVIDDMLMIYNDYIK